MSLLNKKYIVIKNILSKELVDIYYQYIKSKNTVYKNLISSGFINPFNRDYGVIGDKQAKKSYCLYGDILLDNILVNLKSEIEKQTKLKLSEMYTYARIYKQMDELKRHKDRGSCEISGTINLGGDLWPIYIDPNPKHGKHKKDGTYIPGGEKGVEILLEPGDCMLYMGTECEHWRESLMEKECVQVFLHYRQTEGLTENDLYDKRMSLGMPDYTTKKINN